MGWERQNLKPTEPPPHQRTSPWPGTLTQRQRHESPENQETPGTPTTPKASTPLTHPTASTKEETPNYNTLLQPPGEGERSHPARPGDLGGGARVGSEELGRARDNKVTWRWWGCTGEAWLPL